MSWGILETTGGPILLAVGRDVSDRRAAEARLRAVAAIGERALAGADPADLAGQSIALLRTLLPIEGAELQMADGSDLAASGQVSEPGVRLAIGDGAELLIEPARSLQEEELNFVRAVASTLATALARLRSEERTRYEALHDPLTGLANRTLLRDRLEHALARREHGATAAAVRRPRQLQADQRRPRPRRGRRRAGGDRPAPTHRRATRGHRRAARGRRVRRAVRGDRRGGGARGRPAPAGCDPDSARRQRHRAPPDREHRDRAR